MKSKGMTKVKKKWQAFKWYKIHKKIKIVKEMCKLGIKENVQ